MKVSAVGGAFALFASLSLALTPSAAWAQVGNQCLDPFSGIEGFQWDNAQASGCIDTGTGLFLTREERRIVGRQRPVKIAQLFLELRHGPRH